MSFSIQEFLRRKRDGGLLNETAINDFVAGVADGEIGDAQIAAFCMACFFRPLAMDETIDLTRAMTRCGETLSWSDLALDGPCVDKHSTGGVGDHVSLMLAPLLAACGAYVPMISGRGLGHTGGTLDKLESIPGYDIRPSAEVCRKTLKQAGCFIIGQSATLAPADRRMYAVRDVTATVEPMELIVASILSKKLAAGLEHLLIDVKCGNGAFAATPEFARELARRLVRVANGAGLSTSAMITDMNQPLACAAGNALELRDAVTFLEGKHKNMRLEQVVLGLGGELLSAAGLAPDPTSAEQRLRHAIDSGDALQRFQDMAHSLGGPADLIENLDKHLPAAPVVRAATAPRSGCITAIDTRGLGLAVVELGGGRHRPEQPIDHRVGLSELAGLHRRVVADQPLALVHAARESDAVAAVRAVERAYTIGDECGAADPVVIEKVGPKQVTNYRW